MAETRAGWGSRECTARGRAGRQRAEVDNENVAFWCGILFHMFPPYDRKLEVSCKRPPNCTSC